MATAEDETGPREAASGFGRAVAGGVVDTMVTVPGSRDAWQQTFDGIIRDVDSRALDHPAGYLFRDLPRVDGQVDFIAFLLAEMDRHGVTRAVLPVADGDRWGRRGTAEHPDRLHGFVLVDPHRGRSAIDELRRLHRDGHAVAAAVFPAGCAPPVRLDAPALYPLYAACGELDLPVFVHVGVPGPRVPMASQHPGSLAAVLSDFPDLRVICRHGGEPWQALLVAMMRSFPNLSYSTSAFAPRWYPTAIVEFANADGSSQVMYGGYFPSGLSLDRIFSELPDLPLTDGAWPAFLRDNATRILRLP